MKNKRRIIVALDGMSEKEALQIARALRGRVWGFKVNDMLFDGVGIIRKLKRFGNVFADAKLHDIPNTVANSVERLSSAGADFITVHAEGGVEMMKAAKRNAGRSKILAVTVLTSAKADRRKFWQLAKDVIRAGVHGVVLSGCDLPSLGRIRGSGSLIKVVPGIRPRSYRARDDQKRTVTPEIAFTLGADFIVLGRPITKARNPPRAFVELLFQQET